MTTKQLTTTKFSGIMTSALNLSQKHNVRVHIYESSALSNSNLKSKIQKLYRNAQFSSLFDESEIDCILALVDITSNTPVSVLILREYIYTPKTKRKFLHIEYGITSPLYEGRGFSTILRMVCLAFAFNRSYGGVSSYAISYGSQIPLTRLGFKTLSPMKYTLLLNNNNKLNLYSHLQEQGKQLSPNREAYYRREYKKIKKTIISNALKKKLGVKRDKSVKMLETNAPNINQANLQYALSRLQSLRSTYEQMLKFTNPSLQSLENQYIAELLKTHLPQNTKKEGWLGNGMAVTGLCPNKICGNVHTYRPWISHIFTFASQKAKLKNVIGDLLLAMKTESNKPRKVFTPKVQKPKKSIMKTMTKVQSRFKTKAK